MKWRDRLAMRILFWIAEQLFTDQIKPAARNELANIRTALNVHGKEAIGDE